MRRRWHILTFASLAGYDGCMKLRTLLGSFFVVAAIGGWAPSSEAAEAVFTPDGKKVYFTLSYFEPGLFQADIATGKVTEVALPAELKEKKDDVMIEINSLALGSEGEVLFLAKDAVWVAKEGSPVKRVFGTDGVANASGLFICTKPGHPFKDWVMVSATTKEEADQGGRLTFFARMPGAKNTFRTVFCRRVEDALGGTWSADGRFFFISSGDVWEGDLEKEEDISDPEMIVGTLVGARFAPVAILNTDSANGGGLWAHQIAAAGSSVYVHLGARHTATLLRLPMTPKPLYASQESDLPELKAHLQAMAKSLQGAEVIFDESERIFALAATEVAGKPRVFFCTPPNGEEKPGPVLMLWEGKGPARTIGNVPLKEE